MRRIVLILLGVLMLSVPRAASAQATAPMTTMPPPIVQGLNDPAKPIRYGPWIGVIAGSTIAVVGINAWTGGALLAPAVGPALSGLVGGTWLGLSAMTPLVAQGFFQTTSLVAYGIAGGVVGHWLGSR